MLEDWDPPRLGEGACRWLLSQLAPPVFLKLLRAVNEDPGGRVALSGFRLTENGLKRPTLREAVEAKLVPLLMSSPVANSLLFIVSFPDARWFRWAEVLAVHDEHWLLVSWRDLIRDTGDPALAVALALDDRPRLARRGERILRTGGLWTGVSASGRGEVPEVWRELIALTGHFGNGEGKGLETPNHRLQARLAEAEARLKESETERVRLGKQVKTLQRRAEELAAERRRSLSVLSALEKELKVQRTRLHALDENIDIEIRSRMRRFYSEFVAPDFPADTLWREELAGGVDDVVERAAAALDVQRRLDVRYGLLSTVNARIARLEATLRDVRGALADSLVPAVALRQVQHELELKLTQWRQMLPGASEAVSPVAEALLAHAVALPVDETGIRAVEELAEALNRPPLAFVLVPEERDLLLGRLEEVIARRKKMWQAGLIAGHLPEFSGRREVVEISNLSAFVVKNQKLCEDSILLVDGYNVIKTSAEWAASDRRNFALTRGRFCRSWELRAADWKRVELVFDGKEDHCAVEERGRLTVVFTDGRSESQRADLFIQERLKEIKARDPQTPLFLATADRALREAAAEWVDYFVEPKWSLVPYLSLQD